jgi:hypothetical protein
MQNSKCKMQTANCKLQTANTDGSPLSGALVFFEF